MAERQKKKDGDATLGLAFKEALANSQLNQPFPAAQKGGDAKVRAAKDYVEIDAALKEHGKPVNQANRLRAEKLLAAGFEVNSAALELSVAEINKARRSLEKPPYFSPSLSTILSYAGTAARKKAEFTHLETLVRLAPERTKALFDTLRTASFYCDEMERFLATDYGKKFAGLLQALDAKQEAKRNKQEKDESA